MKITVLKNVHLYDPREIGRRNIVMIHDKIAAVAEDTQDFERLSQAAVYDCGGMRAVPGFVDLHVHITGAGGEQGPASRVPEANIGEIFASGCTTVLGMLGVDGVSRSNENLITKARALSAEGLTCFVLVSNYALPPKTVTGSIEKDILMIDPVIGVKCALAEPRASYPTEGELIRMATAVRRGGLLSGKAGLIVFHIGNGPGRMKELLDLARQSIVPLKHLLPTHVNLQWNSELAAQSEEYIRLGGTVDYTAGFSGKDMENTAEAIATHYRKFGNLNSITLSSDSYGSCPELDGAGNVIGMTYATGKYLLAALKKITEDHGIPLEEGLKLLTSNPARVLCLENTKGHIRAGADADLLLLDERFQIHTLFAGGMAQVRDGTVLNKGFYSHF